MRTVSLTYCQFMKFSRKSWRNDNTKISTNSTLKNTFPFHIYGSLSETISHTAYAYLPYSVFKSWQSNQ